MKLRHFLIPTLLLCLCAAAQELDVPAMEPATDLSGPIVRMSFAFDAPPGLSGRKLDLPAASLPESLSEPIMGAPMPDAFAIAPDPAPQIEFKPRGIDWTGTATQSFFFLSIQHSTRLVQKKTRRELKGKFFDEWVNAVSGLNGWGDGDSILTNYVGHPMMGAISGWILIQNDPSGIGKEFDVHDMSYWNSRLRAMGWAAIYSTQFELGPVSEATIGHVGKVRGTAGAVDLVMTPVGGMGWIVAEDAVDKHLIMKLEDGSSDGMKRFVRILFNPNRSVANVLRLKKPWWRDTRPMSWDNQ